MKVLFAHKEHPIEPLGIGYIASSIAKGGHESDLVLVPKDLNEAVRIIESSIENYKPRILAQSIIFGSHGYAIELSRRIKEKYPEIISFLGGPAATFTPELLEKGFDAICRYEGEAPFLEFCNAIERGHDVGNIANIWVKENPDLYNTEKRKKKNILDIEDPGYLDESGYDSERKRYINSTRALANGASLDAIPDPDRRILYQHRLFGEGPIKHFMHTRGCAFKCAYCFNVIQNLQNKGKGKTVRRRGNEEVFSEINAVKNDKWPLELVYFQDDVFGPIYKKKWAQEFAEDYRREVNIPFHAHVRFDLIDEDRARALAYAGCTGVHVAIEAGDDDIRNRVHMRGMTDKQILEGAEALRKNGIKMMTQNILGAPGETKEQMLQTLRLNIEVKPTFASASIFQPYPGTKALEYARDTNSLPAQDLNELVDSFGMETFYSGSILTMDPDEHKWLERFQRFFAIAVDQPTIYESGALDRIIDNYPETDEADNSLVTMYRSHRAEKDDELYGVKLTDVVDATEGAKAVQAP